ncbi:MAG: dockerin type I repeat-containing protein [Candidatus Taylorbacteria bacterium]
MSKYAKTTLLRFSLLTVALVLPILIVNATDPGSASYKVIDSSFNSVREMTSASFGLTGSMSQIAIGSSTATTFMLNSGFLYFPKVTTPVVTASAGDAKVDLSWTASEGFLGFNIGGYLVGQSNTSGGPYTFTSVGNVTSATRSSLTNSQPYFFIIQAQDAFGMVVASSTEVSATPVATTPVTPPVVPPTPPTGGGSSGGGGGAGSPSPAASTKISLKGLAYPGAKIVILKDASIGKQVIADSNGDFAAEFPVSSGIYSFGIYALDKDNYKSPTFGFTVNAIAGQSVTTSDIIVAPTITSDKSVVKIGNTIKFFGYSYPISSVNIMINSEKEILDQTIADKYGRWIYTLNSSLLEKGEHTTKSQTIANKNIASAFSSLLGFQVGDKDVLNTAPKATACSAHADINNDGKVNITDFSILMYFWGNTKPTNPCADLNGDGRVNLQDFSIMMYWWTGTR